MDQKVIEQLQQLRSVIAYHEKIGIKGYLHRKELETIFQLGEDFFQQNQTSTEVESGFEQKNKEAIPLSRPDDTVAELCEEIRVCRSCELYQRRVKPVCGTGGRKVKLLIVGAWLTIENPDEKTDTLFGLEEDIMLAKMYRAIQLNDEDVFITNVIKCGIPGIVQPQGIHIETCLSYLERQIALMSPEIICTMGTVATRALLKVKKPLSQLRGTFHQYKLGKEKTIAVMPTYHPSFLLNNTEMKKPTWADLQRIEKALSS